mgnify:CR=1 FL=1
MDTESDVFFLVEFDQKLGRIVWAFLTIPLHEVLEILLVLKDRAEAAQSDSLERIVAALNKIEQNLDTLDVEEVKLRTFVAKNGILKAVKSGEDESCRVSWLVDLTILHVVFQDLNSTQSAESLLIVSTVFADVGQDIESKLSDVKSSDLCLVLDQVKESLDEVALHELYLEEIKEGSR